MIRAGRVVSRLADLPPDLQDRLGGRDVIVFDGFCCLCAGLVQFVLRHDTSARFHFAPAQSPLGQRLYASLGLPTDRFETYLVIMEGRIFTKAQAFGALMGALGGVWRLFMPLRHLPLWLTSPAYDLVARHRYRIWGRRAVCMRPDAGSAARFLS